MPEYGSAGSGLVSGRCTGREDNYEFVSCLACTQLHFVNWATGKVLRSEVRE